MLTRLQARGRRAKGEGRRARGLQGCRAAGPVAGDVWYVCQAKRREMSKRNRTTGQAGLGLIAAAAIEHGARDGNNGMECEVVAQDCKCS
jgi:hypothetical protein